MVQEWKKQAKGTTTMTILIALTCPPQNEAKTHSKWLAALSLYLLSLSAYACDALNKLDEIDATK